MDTNRAITYRGFLLNDPDISDNISPDTGIAGCQITSVSFTDIDVVQYKEKRSESDGMDAGPVFLGGRRIHLAGTLYAASRPLLFDALTDLRAALSPTLAFRESPLTFGYLPLTFSVPTTRVLDDEYPDGFIDMRVLAIPWSLSYIEDDDTIGGDDADKLAIPFQATFQQIDPSMTGEDPVEVSLGVVETKAVTGVAATDLFTSTDHQMDVGQQVVFTAVTGGAGLVTNSTVYYVIASGLTVDAFKLSLTDGGSSINFTTDLTAGTIALVGMLTNNFTTNRGNYASPLMAQFVVGRQAGTILVTMGTSVFLLTVPASTGTRIVRVKGDQKFVTLEEGGTEHLAMSLISWPGEETWPLMPPGLTEYTVVTSGLINTGGEGDTRLWYYETYA